MKNKKKVFVLLPDGVGLRNFAFTKFHTIGEENGNEITYWNNTNFDLNKLGYKELKTPKFKIHPLTDLYKAAKIQVQLNQYKKRFNDSIYDSYKFSNKIYDLKSLFKHIFIRFLVFFYNYKRGYVDIQKKIEKLERKTNNYFACLKQMQDNKPDFVFCTNQRPVLATAPLLAARELKIPTASFIFSWDNLPKATLVIETDYYFVWSDFMKNELLKYYPHIKSNQVMVTGTPQFEPHYDDGIVEAKEVFYEKNNLDVNVDYICFSGDDITTSPNDPFYLEDLASSLRALNQNGYKLGVIFRRCPVDFSDRYDEVLKKYSDVITPIVPLWEKQGGAWDTIMPTKQDLELLVNIIKHTLMVVNLGSSMVFDYITMKKPCLYVNYDIIDGVQNQWTIDEIYNFVHFRSMPSKESVVWINSKNEFYEKIEQVIVQEKNVVESAQEWFELIVKQPANQASICIWETIDSIVENNK